MGLIWSAPKPCKQGTLIVIDTSMDEINKKDLDLIWKLWSIKKDDLKKDGFSITKNKYTERYQILYFHKVNNKSYEKINSPNFSWKDEFDQKIINWTVVINQLNEFFKGKVDKITEPSKGVTTTITSEYIRNDDEDLKELENMLKKV